jgi:hypothetical protein
VERHSDGRDRKRCEEKAAYHGARNLSSRSSRPSVEPASARPKAAVAGQEARRADAVLHDKKGAGGGNMVSPTWAPCLKTPRLSSLAAGPTRGTQSTHE